MIKMIYQNKMLRVKRIRAKLAEHLKSGCVDCPEKDIVVLDLDHVDPSTKIAEVTWLIAQGYSEAIVFAEVAKCVIRCSNCHRKRTAKDQNSWRWKYNNGKW